MSICGGSDIPFPILVLLLIILLGVVAKVPKQAFFISPASPFPASLRIKLCFCLEMSERSLLCGDEASSCWITTQITEGWYQFIAVWSGKGINSGFWFTRSLSYS